MFFVFKVKFRWENKIVSFEKDGKEYKVNNKCIFSYNYIYK